MRYMLTQSAGTLLKVVKVLGLVSLGVALIAPLGSVLFAAAGTAFACLIAWIWLDEIVDSQKDSPK